MKKQILIFFVIFICATAFAQNQNEVRASMGIEFISTPSLSDYLEANYPVSVSSFNSAVNFSGAYGRMVSPNTQLEIELGYMLNSFNSSSIEGSYNMDYNIFMPSVLYYYVLSGSGYNFKFGGGAGIRFLSVTEKLPADPNDYNYSSLGYGAILRAAGNTAISNNIYAYISADMRYDVNGEPDDSNGNKIYNNIYNENVNFNSLSFGVHLGISYQF